MADAFTTQYPHVSVGLIDEEKDADHWVRALLQGREHRAFERVQRGIG
jgi:hypothetical protein